MDMLWEAFKAWVALDAEARAYHSLVVFDDASGYVQDGHDNPVFSFEDPDDGIKQLGES